MAKPQYIGFSTINARLPRPTGISEGFTGGYAKPITPFYPGRKFRLTDEALVVQDFVNALSIPKGQKVGQPGYGTTLWDFVHDPNTRDVQDDLVAEITRVASLDPRLLVNMVKAYPQENGILVEVECAVTPFQQARLLSLFMNGGTDRIENITVM
jgi:phage baseplate assembly protein W